MPQPLDDSATDDPATDHPATDHSATDHSAIDHPATVPVVGAITWLVWAVATRPSWTAILLMMSPFVLVPLGLWLAEHPSTGPTTALLGRLRLLTLPLALCAALAFSFDPGFTPALLTVPWMLFTAAIAAVGLGRFLSRRTFTEAGIGVDAGLMFIVVGGAWLTISRFGANPMGFSDDIVRLTAVHFHYAGFALPLVAGIVAIRSRRGWWVPLATIVGVPFTAIGITVGGVLEWAAATFMAGAGFAVAASMLRAATGGGRGTPLLIPAGIALGGGMVMSLLYSWSNGLAAIGFDDIGGPSIDFMARTHGSLNALGFGLLGLTALALAPAPTPDARRRASMFLGRPSERTLAALHAEAATAEPPIEPGLLHRATPDGFRRDVWGRPAPDYDDACAGITAWAGHAGAGIVRHPERPPIEVGQTLALAIPVGPLAVTATSRIVEVIDEPDRFGFAYLALDHHPERGEESFIVYRDPAGSHHVEVTAVWATGGVASDLCPPVTRWLQRRAINRYLDGIVAYRPTGRLVQP